MIVMMALVIVSSRGFAAMPDISAGKTDFDITKGLYILTDKVKVVLEDSRVITSEKAVVSIKNQKVWANGDVSMDYDGLKFRSDKIFVRGFDKTAEAVGNLQFNTKTGLKITATYGTFNWGTKEADFYGSVKVNGAKDIKKNVNYAHVKYNVVEDKITLVENAADISVQYQLTETDPTEK